VKIVANIFISFIGAGVLGLPYAFKRAGLMEGVLVMVFVSYFAIKAMLLIIDCKYKVLSVLYQYENLTEDLDESGEKKKSPGGEKKVLNC
jgi:proton-coupled amino acid transporter